MKYNSIKNKVIIGFDISILIIKNEKLKKKLIGLTFSKKVSYLLERTIKRLTKKSSSHDYFIRKISSQCNHRPRSQINRLLDAQVISERLSMMKRYYWCWAELFSKTSRCSWLKYIIIFWHEWQRVCSSFFFEGTFGNIGKVMVAFQCSYWWPYKIFCCE